MKRQRHVYPTDRIAHLWYHQTQESARNPSSNLYFQGRTIYSYGSHFPIAVVVDTPEGSKAVFMTTRTYSVTTGGHISAVRHAIPSGTPIFNFANEKEWISCCGKPCHKHNLADYRARIAALQRDIDNGRTFIQRAMKVNAKKKLTAEANRYCEVFQLATRFPAADDIPADEIEDLQRYENYRVDKQQKQAARYFREREERERLNAMDSAERLQQWISGKTVSWQYLPHSPVRLRLRGDEIETSRGASFPLSHATRILRAIRQVQRSGEPWQANGHSIPAGVFRVDAIDAAGNVTAGCHYITIDEIDRIAQLLKLPETTE